MPTREKAYELLNEFTGCNLPSYLPQPLPLKQLFTNHHLFNTYLQDVIQSLGIKSLLLFVPIIKNELIEIPYPCISGYSDYFMIRNDALKNAADIFAVFATMNLFVEIAIPTAIALTFDRTEVALLNDTEYQAGAIWSPDEVTNLAEKNNYSIKCLFENWEKGKLFVHPVKLSKWSIE